MKKHHRRKLVKSVIDLITALLGCWAAYMAASNYAVIVVVVIGIVQL